MKISLSLVLLSCLIAPVRADDAEVLVGASPERCRAERIRRPPPGQPAQRKLGGVLTWLAAHTCEQYLVPRSLLGRAVELDPKATAEEIARVLPSVLGAFGLTSRPYAVTRVAASPADEPPVSTAPVDPASGIRCRGDACSVPRATIDALLSDPARLAASARIVPAIRDGKVSGFKLYAIRPGSIYAGVGLQNGDTVLSINGFQLTDPSAALEAYTHLRGAARLSITLERRGAPRVLTVEIDGGKSD